MSGETELEAFLHDPEQYVSPATPHLLPPPDLLPARRSQSDVKAMFPKRFEMQGFCPVTYVDGKRRYIHVHVCHCQGIQYGFPLATCLSPDHFFLPCISGLNQAITLHALQCGNIFIT